MRYSNLMWYRLLVSVKILFLFPHYYCWDIIVLIGESRDKHFFETGQGKTDNKWIKLIQMIIFYVYVQNWRSIDWSGWYISTTLENILGFLRVLYWLTGLLIFLSIKGPQLFLLILLSLCFSICFYSYFL